MQRKGIVASRFCDSLQQIRGREKKYKGKIKFMGKIERQYYTHGVTEYSSV
jgi:hypothetical protein